MRSSKHDRDSTTYPMIVLLVFCVSHHSRLLLDRIYIHIYIIGMRSEFLTSPHNDISEVKATLSFFLPLFFLCPSSSETLEHFFPKDSLLLFVCK